MRSSLASGAIIAALAASASVLAADPASQDSNRSPEGPPRYRPQLVIASVEPTKDSAFVTIRGVVFSRSPIDRVNVGARQAMIRPADSKDLVKIDRLPKGASEAPIRTFFELPDSALPRTGANDLVVAAYAADGTASDAHRVTILRPLPPDDQRK